mgnify:CR=1 FL=1
MNMIIIRTILIPFPIQLRVQVSRGLSIGPAGNHHLASFESGCLENVPVILLNSYFNPNNHRIDSSEVARPAHVQDQPERFALVVHGEVRLGRQTIPRLSEPVFAVF